MRNRLEICPSSNRDMRILQSPKSQSAMEYLMTYGWAILIIAIVLVALFSLGVFNSSNFSPRAQPGSCEVFRTSAQISLEGQCNGMLPKYVAIFNGNDASVVVPSLSITVPPGDPFTVTEWINVKSILSAGTTGCGEDPRDITETNGLENYFQTNNGQFPGYVCSWFQTASGGDCGDSGANINQNTWYFIAATTNGVNYCAYTNGAGGCNMLTNSLLAGVSHVSVGRSDGCGLWFNGSVANLQIYNTALSRPEVQALYQEGIGGAPINVNNLIGWWPLNGNANDYSGYGNDGVSNNVTYTSAWASGYSAP